MKKTYLKKKIKKYERYNQILMILTLLFGIFMGRYFFYEDTRNLISGAVVGFVGVIILFLIERNIRSTVNFEKGSKLEDQIVTHLESMGYTCKQSISTGKGDLDILAIKSNRCYGIESKSESGTITFSNGKLYVNNFSKYKYLDSLLSNCKIVRNKEYGTDSHIFVEPIIVFGYGATLEGIPKEGVQYKNTNIKICSIKNLRSVLS
jgi:hypothetical protein